jgi:pyruvate dehydrogenase E2 component (dihydrolipoamide acetyltransferase)
VISLRLEQLSLSMEEGVVTRWLVPDGAHVQRGQPIVEVETDKSTVELEAPASGTLHIRVAEGAVVPVDALLAEVGEGGPSTPLPGQPSVPVPAPAAPVAGRAPSDAASEARPDGGKQSASPAARRLARELGVELASLAGSGPGGRIVARDVDQATQTAAPPLPPVTRTAGQLRDLVVEGITQSWRAIPHIHIGGELAADGLAHARRVAPSGVTVTDLLLLAVARALRDVPEVNGHVASSGAVLAEHVHLALAVATDNGVVAPVLREADTLSVHQIAAERARLVAAARAGLLAKRDLGGATCTLSNLGAYPVDFFAPVISGPQICLVATGRLAEKPVAIDGMLAVRSRLWVNAAVDHRGADGEAGGRFLAALERRLADLPATIS